MATKSELKKRTSMVGGMFVVCCENIAVAHFEDLKDYHWVAKDLAGIIKVYDDDNDDEHPSHYHRGKRKP